MTTSTVKVHKNLEDYRFCPRCGSAMKVQTYGGDTEAPTCQNDKCGFIFWQHAHPCATALIVRDDGHILMTIRDIEPDKGKLDLPGGFLHETEEPAAGAIREVKEELGVDIELTDFLGHTIDAYGDHDFYTLVACFAAHITNGTVSPKDEIAGIEWIDPATLDRSRLAFTNNARCLDMWLEKQQEQRS